MNKLVKIFDANQRVNALKQGVPAIHFEVIDLRVLNKKNGFISKLLGESYMQKRNRELAAHAEETFAQRKCN